MSLVVNVRVRIRYDVDSPSEAYFGDEFRETSLHSVSVPTPSRTCLE